MVRITFLKNLCPYFEIQDHCEIHASVLLFSVKKCILVAILMISSGLFCQILKVLTATGDDCFYWFSRLPPDRQTDLYCGKSTKRFFNGIMKVTESINNEQSAGGG